jgi:DNA polymerase I-like protein with 3'-5' exonuclease and polymerase domains
MQKSRFDGGQIWAVDYSQIELRMAAILSKDPTMVREFQDNRDRHVDRAVELVGSLDVWAMNNIAVAQKSGTPEVKASALSGTFNNYLKAAKDWLRQAGKTINFLILFRGQGKKAHDTILEDLGIDIPESRCQEVVDATYGRYPRFVDWQDERIAEVERTGLLKLRFSGLKRTFVPPYLLGHTQIEVPEVVNFEIQAYAAMYTQAAHDVMNGLLVGNYKSRVVMNQYDCLFIDVHPDEVALVRGYVDRAFMEHPLEGEMNPEGPEHVPLKYDVKVLAGPPLLVSP